MTSSGGFGTQLVPYDFDSNETTDILFERSLPGGGNEYLVWTLNGLSILEQAVIGSGGSTWSLDRPLADYDGNGTTDILFNQSVAPNTTQYGVWLIDGIQVIGQAATGIAVPNWTGLDYAFGDFDGNGAADPLFDELSFSNGTEIHRYGIWLSDGTELLVKAPIGINADTPIWFVADASYYNKDNKSDLLFAREVLDINDTPTGGYQYGVWTIDGIQVTGQATIGTSGDDWGFYNYAADFNGDGTTDLVFSREVFDNGNFLGTQYGVWTIDGTQTTSQAAVDIATPGWFESYAFDTNGDGANDLVFKGEVLDVNDTLIGYQYAVWTLNGTQATSQAVIGSTDTSWDFIDNTKNAGDFNDFNGDGKTDMLFSREIVDNGNIVGYEYGLWLLDGTNVISQKVIGSSGEGWVFTGGADTNADGIADLGFINETTAEYAVWILGSDGSVTGQAVLGAYDNVNNPLGWSPVTDFYYIEPA